MSRISECTIDELFVKLMANTIKDGEVIFYGGSSPLAMIAVYLAKNTNAPNLVHIGGNPAGLDPKPPFLPPTTHDWTMLEHALGVLPIDYVFDLGSQGKIDRMFLSGAQIDMYGNTNVTTIGGLEKMKVKLPGGGGGAKLSCDIKNGVLWTTRHRVRQSSRGKVYTIVPEVDFVTAVGHKTPSGSREELGLIGNGPEWAITNLGVFDFEEKTRAMRLRYLLPDTTIDDVLENTGFEPAVHSDLKVVELPTSADVEFIRNFDSLEIRKREFPPEELERKFTLGTVQ
ncbi:MAG: acyl CoA--acetate/3-ketoacid CoA transferase subunit beta [Candidatus Dadabacteria bacterium]|nr:MAG: acyl CoA--acetate/3-ketoacid CoA transferase subunit beta [Candidatus Dadabacteria bacterium]